MIRKLALISLCLTAVVIVFGAYVRLSDAGLGCPDWPGCYGELSPHHARDEILAAHQAEPLGPVSMPKAWKEMIHRYLASGLGLLILGIAALAIRRWRVQRELTPWLALSLVGVVIFQGLLGKWTVTLLLKPAIVTLHLLGGLTTFGMLMWLLLREMPIRRDVVAPGLVLAARAGFVLLIVQIFLGGWVSTNYAALACTDLPTCQGRYLPEMDFAHAFHMFRELGETADGAPLPLAALTAIHWTHRVMAVIVGLWLLGFAAQLGRVRPEQRNLALALALAVAAQIMLGLGNVAFSLPLLLAVAHNAGALALVGLMLLINYRLRSQPAPAERFAHESLAA